MQVAGPERTRLFVEGVQTAITADVTRRRRDGLVVTQALPFLRLDTTVREPDGTRARIARVAIAMDGDVPRLLLELAHDEDAALEAPVTEREDTREPTMPAFTPGVSLRPVRTDSTVPYAFDRSQRVKEVVVGAHAVEPPPPESPPRRPWWSRLLGRLAALWAALSRRSLPALPPA